VSESKGYSFDGGRLIIRDALLLHTPSSLLKLTKSYNKHYVKLDKEEIDISKLYTFRAVEDNKKLIKQYCYQDCLSLMELVEMTYTKIYKLSAKMAEFHTTRPLTMTVIKTKFTTASLAMLLMVHHFFVHDIKDNEP